MKLLIIRHGEPDYAVDSLTEKGWFEAELLSRRLVKSGIDDIYCSPLGRAKDTAKPTLEKLKREAEILPWLREFAGKVKSPLTGKDRIPWDLAPSSWANTPKLYDLHEWTDTELIRSGNAKEVYQETVTGITTLLEGYGLHREGMLYRSTEKEERTVALFCHFAMGMTIISHLTGLSPFILWHNFFMPTSSVSTLVTETDSFGGTHFRCVQIGDTSHLYTADEPISLSGLYPDFNQ